VAKLRVAIWMVGPFFCLAVALQAVVKSAKHLGDFLMAHRMLLLDELRSNRARALANPLQGGLWISSCFAIDDPIQHGGNERIGNSDRFAPRAGPTNMPLRRHRSLSDFAQAFCDRFSRKSTGSPHQRDPSVA